MSQSVHDLSVALVEAVQLNDLDQARALVGCGADPFLACAPVDVYVVNPGLNLRVRTGCAAAQAIHQPDLLAAILPNRMDGFPLVTRAISVWGLVSRQDEEVCLGQWAIEAGAIQSLSAMIGRMDRSSDKANQSLARLLRACAWGCNVADVGDVVYSSLLLLLAARVDLGDDWSAVETLALREPIKMVDGLWQYDHVPLSFSLLCKSKDGNSAATSALQWLLNVRPSIAKLGLEPPVGCSLLHWAVAHGAFHHITMTLLSGCDPDQKNSEGMTAADLALALDKPEGAALIHSWSTSRHIERIRLMGATLIQQSQQQDNTAESP